MKMASPECSSNVCAKGMLKVPFVVVFLFLDGMFINSMESRASPQAQKPILKKGFSRATYLLLDLLVALSSGHH